VEVSLSIQEERALSEITALVRAHPALAETAGRELWSLYESSVEEQQSCWAQQVAKRLEALEHARGQVLDSSHEVPLCTSCGLDWMGFVELMAKRERQYGDLCHTTAKQAYLDDALLSVALPATPEGMVWEVLDYVERRALVEQDGYVHHIPRADFFFVRQLTEGMGQTRSPRVLAQSMRLAVVILVARVFEIDCMSLGLGRELPLASVAGRESREFICSLAKGHLPREGADGSFSALVVSVAESLWRALGPQADHPAVGEQGDSTPSTLEGSPRKVANVKHMVLIALDLIGATDSRSPSSLTFLSASTGGSKSRFRTARDSLKAHGSVCSVPCVGFYLTLKGRQEARELREEYGVSDIDSAIRALGIGNERLFREGLADFRVSRKLS